MSSRQQVVNRFRNWVRRSRKRLDNPEVKQARRLLQRLESGPVDVLHFGASESLFTAPYDDDARTLPQMIDDGLGPDTSMYSVIGPGYHPRLVNRYLDIATSHGARPVVIVGMCVRFGDPAWADHPEYGYKRSLRALNRIGTGRPSWRYRAVVPLATAEDFADYDRADHASVLTSMPIGDYRRALKNPKSAGLDGAGVRRLLYAYHHGTVTLPIPAFLSDVTALGRRLRELGLKVVVYQMPVPVARGAELLGEELRDHVERRIKVMDDAFVAGYGPVEILQTGMTLPVDEFIDPDDASEHVNERGRHRIADLVIAAVRDRLAQ